MFHLNYSNNLLIKLLFCSENPLWGERDFKMYEEQELSMRLSNGMPVEEQNVGENESDYATLNEGQGKSRQRNIESQVSLSD